MPDRHTHTFCDIREVRKITGTLGTVYFLFINIKIDQIIIT